MYRYWSPVCATNVPGAATFANVLGLAVFPSDHWRRARRVSGASCTVTNWTAWVEPSLHHTVCGAVNTEPSMVRLRPAGVVSRMYRYWSPVCATNVPGAATFANVLGFAVFP